MIYTGYFAQAKKYKGILMSVAGKTPKSFNGIKLRCFMPKFWFFQKWKNGEISNDEYVEIFKKEVLDHINKESIKNFLSSDKDLFLLCYEKSDDFCHRHIVADWIRNELGLDVREYEVMR